MTDLLAKVTKVVRDQGELKDDPPPDAHLIHDLGFDSLSLVELTLALERQFGREIPDSDAMGLRSVREIAAYLARRPT